MQVRDTFSRGYFAREKATFWGVGNAGPRGVRFELGEMTVVILLPQVTTMLCGRGHWQ